MGKVRADTFKVGHRVRDLVYGDIGTIESVDERGIDIRFTRRNGTSYIDREVVTNDGTYDDIEVVEDAEWKAGDHG